MAGRRDAAELPSAPSGAICPIEQASGSQFRAGGSLWVGAGPVVEMREDAGPPSAPHLRERGCRAGRWTSDSCGRRTLGQRGAQRGILDGAGLPSAPHLRELSHRAADGFQFRAVGSPLVGAGPIVEMLESAGLPSAPPGVICPPCPRVAPASGSRIAISLIGGRATRWRSLRGRCVERGQCGGAEARGAAVHSKDGTPTMNAAMRIGREGK